MFPAPRRAATKTFSVRDGGNDMDELDEIFANIQKLKDAGLPFSEAERYLKSVGYNSAAEFKTAYDAAAKAAGPRIASPIDRLNEGPGMAETLRLAAAGIAPGVSDEIVGAVRGAVLPGETVGEGIDAERAALAEARAKPGAGAIEFGAGVVGVGKLAQAKKIPGALRTLLGLGKSAPATIPQGIVQGLRTGAVTGAVAGAGSKDDGSLMERLAGGAVGSVVGGGLGGFVGGAIPALTNRFAPPQLDQTKMQNVFGRDLPPEDALSATRTLSDQARRGQVSMSPVGRQTGQPRILADDSPIFRHELRQAEGMDRVGAETKANKAFFTDRATERGPRRAARIERETGRAVRVSPAEYVDQLKAEKNQIDDAMFARARAQARETGVGIPFTSLDDKAMLTAPEVVQIVDGLADDMDRMRRSGRLAKEDRFVDPFLRNAKGKVTGVKPAVDPTTLDVISRRLGEVARATRDAGDANKAADFFAFKSRFDTQLDAVPAFGEARAASAQMNRRIEAAEFGASPGREARLPEDITSTTAEWQRTPALRLPPEVAKATGIKDVASPFTDFQTTFQKFRQGQVLNQTGVKLPPGGRQVEELVFGKKPAKRLRAADVSEADMALTEAASPAFRGRVAGNTTEAQAANADQRSAFQSLRDALRFRDETGASLGAANVGASIIRRLGQPTRGEVTGLMRGLRAGQQGPQQLADMLSLIQQTRQSTDTPFRRGLFDALTFTAGSSTDRPY